MPNVILTSADGNSVAEQFENGGDDGNCCCCSCTTTPTVATKLSGNNDEKLEQYNTTKCLRAECRRKKKMISYIDDDDDEDEDGHGGQQENKPSSSTATTTATTVRRNMSDPYGTFTPLVPNGVLPMPPPASRHPSLAAPPPPVPPERKRTVFKISRATVDDNLPKEGEIEYGRKRSWLEQRQFLLPGDAVAGSRNVSSATLASSGQLSWKCPPNTHNPFAIWRDKFLREHQCHTEDLCREVFLSALPHVVVCLVVSVYVVAGALLFRRLDPHIGQLPFHDVVLFAFTTITTIGYGNIVPVTPWARLACAVYCLLGIPLVFLTLANLGELLADCYWIGLASVKGQKDLLLRDEASRLPLRIIVLLILLHSLLGGLIFHFWIQRMPLFPAIYFSFISITTIGFGDLSPEPANIWETLVVIAYLGSGISIMSTLFNTLSEHLRRIHYLGRDFHGAQDVRVWFGGTRMSLRELVSLVAERFEVPPQRFREVLDELDALIELASPRHSRRRRHHGSLPIPDSVGDRPKGVCVGRQFSADSAAIGQPSIDAADCSPASSINSEQQQLLQALGTLHRLSVKGTRTFHTPSLNSLSLIRSSPAALDLAPSLRHHRLSCGPVLTSRSLPMPEGGGPRRK